MTVAMYISVKEQVSLSSIIYLMLWQHCTYDPVRLTQTQNRLEEKKKIQRLHTNVETVFNYGNCLGSHVWCDSTAVPSSGRFDIQVIIMLCEPDMTQIVDISILGVVEIGSTSNLYVITVLGHILSLVILYFETNIFSFPASKYSLFPVAGYQTDGLLIIVIHISPEKTQQSTTGQYCKYSKSKT